MTADLPLAPRSLPIFGHMPALLFGSPWDVTERWLREGGKNVRMNLIGGEWLATRDLEVIRHILVQNPGNYLKDASSLGVFRDILGSGVLTSDGELWRRHRAILGKAFRIDALRDVPRITGRAVERLFARWDQAADAGAIVDVGDAFRILTLEVIAEATLGMEPDRCDAIFPRLYEPLVAECNRRVWHPYRAWLPSPTRRRYRRCLAELNEFLRDLIHERRALLRASPREPVDMLDMLLLGVAELPWTGALAELVCDELKTMLFAGHDTSSAMLTWTVHALSRRPELLQRLQAEADRVLPGGSIPEYEALRALEFSQACLKEALRLYNIVPVVTRVADRDDRAGEVEIAAGTRIMIHIQAVHLDPEHWPDPGRFDPDRFLGGQGTGYRWLPFITGSRSCVGQHFSLLEAKIVLALLGQRYELLPQPGNGDERHRFHAPIAPRSPIRMQVRRRS